MSEAFDALAKDLQDRCDEAAVKRFGQNTVDRWKNPRFVGEMPSPSLTFSTDGACGDLITMYLRITGERIDKASFYANGCGTGVVCGDACAELLEGKTVREALAITDQDIIATAGGLPKDKRKTAAYVAEALGKALRDWLSRQA